MTFLVMSCSLLPLPCKLNVKSKNPSFISQGAIKARTNQSHGFKVSCNVAPGDHNDNQLILPEMQKLLQPNVDRRNLLVGLGGLYTAKNFASLPAALAVPITTPDITSICEDASSGIDDLGGAIRSRKCCPPAIGKTIKPFVFPKENTVRMRWPAHKGTKENVEKYKKAIQAMRDLDPKHPHSFESQAKIHCAYCNGGYTQENDDKKQEIQIHNSWLFFPFHRWYLYFYERILGKLINDPTFALPYWNWDNPDGMPIPPIFQGDENNPLYDENREPGHLKQLVNLGYYTPCFVPSNENQITCNLVTVYRDLISNGGDTLSFFGGIYKAGDAPVPNNAPSVGSVEANSHTAVHRWVGVHSNPNQEDMGNFYSAGYDPLFYVHHANVDRMWKLWKDLGLPGHTEPTHPDWLEASYVFYDENEDLVQVYNKDCVNMELLNFGYEESGMPWRKYRPAKRSENTKIATSTEDVKTVEQVKFPVSVEEILKVRVKRPAVNRTKAEKQKANEVLLINGIKFKTDTFVKLDVFVNDIDELKNDKRPLSCGPEYAGGFSQIPHNDKKKMFMTSAARFGLTELLSDTNTEGEEYAVVTLVPRTGCAGLTVSEIKIELVPIV